VGLYDPAVQVGGVLHALLPEVGMSRQSRGHPTKFVDQGVPLLIEAMTALGAKKNRLVAYLCGGAQVINMPVPNSTFSMGQRNILAAHLALQQAGLVVKSEMTGGRVGCTIRLHIANGKVMVKVLGQEEIVLSGNGTNCKICNLLEGAR
jgi:chemotaxis protein CheD